MIDYQAFIDSSRGAQIADEDARRLVSRCCDHLQQLLADNDLLRGERDRERILRIQDREEREGM